MSTEFAAGLEAAGIATEAAAPLARYGELVFEANRRFNLTGAKTPAEIIAHVVDSLSVARFVREPLVDIGSGGGFPAIPLAIATGIAVTLIEATRKKARFLQRMLETFGLAGEVVAERAEIAAHDERWRGRFASGTARAVATAPTVAELLLPFIEPGGVAVLQRGGMDDAERRALEDAALVLGGQLDGEHRLEGERRILLIRKTGPTQPRFPRRVGVPEARPLCVPR